MRTDGTERESTFRSRRFWICVQCLQTVLLLMCNSCMRASKLGWCDVMLRMAQQPQQENINIVRSCWNGISCVCEAECTIHQNHSHVSPPNSISPFEASCRQRFLSHWPNIMYTECNLAWIVANTTFWIYSTVLLSQFICASRPVDKCSQTAISFGHSIRNRGQE